MTHRADAGLEPAKETSAAQTSFVPRPGNQEARRADLRRWKAIALSFLIGAAVIFLGCSWWQASASGAPVCQTVHDLGADELLRLRRV